MKRVLVDATVWSDYFSGNRMGAEALDELIDSNLICVNDIVLAEILPPLLVRRQEKLARLLECVKKIPLAPDWGEVVRWQSQILKSGVARAGVTDLLMAQNAVQNGLRIFTMNRLFYQMRKTLPFDLYEF